METYHSTACTPGKRIKTPELELVRSTTKTPIESSFAGKSTEKAKGQQRKP